jgi:hypothetical protein
MGYSSCEPQTKRLIYPVDEPVTQALHQDPGRIEVSFAALKRPTERCCSLADRAPAIRSYPPRSGTIPCRILPYPRDR